MSPTAGPDESASILRRAGITALVVSITAGITSTVLFAAAYQFRLDIQPTRIVAAGATSAELLRWAAVLDLFGYYLATAVLAYVLWAAATAAQSGHCRLVHFGWSRLRAGGWGGCGRPCRVRP